MTAERSNQSVGGSGRVALRRGVCAPLSRPRRRAAKAPASNQALIDWLGGVCDRFDQPIDALDLGCGTGRYFWGLRNVKTLTGLDASAPMLEEARHPIHGERLSALPVSLVQRRPHDARVSGRQLRSGLLDRRPGRARAARRAGSLIACIRWLRPGGRFAFTTVHPELAVGAAHAPAPDGVGGG